MSPVLGWKIRFNFLCSLCGSIIVDFLLFPCSAFTRSKLLPFPLIKTRNSSSASAMSFHHRKLFHPYLGSSDATMVRCCPILSPLHSPPLEVARRSPLPDGEHTDQYYVLEVFMIVIACTVAGLVLFLFTISKILRNYYSRRYYLSSRNTPILFDINGDSPFSDDEGAAIEHPTWFIPTLGLQQSIIDSITVCKYRKDEGLIQGTECPVCLGEFQQDESLRLLPKCSHAFHVPCIDTWFRSHKNCPLCRAPIVHDSGSGGGGAELLIGTTERDSNLSGGGGNYHIGDSESSSPRAEDDDSALFSSEDGRDSEIGDKKMNCHSAITTASAVSAEEFEEEIQQMSVNLSSASMIFRDGVDLNYDVESSDADLDDKKVSRLSISKDIAIVKQGKSSTICKLASIGFRRALEKRHLSMKMPSSRNRKFTFLRRCRSQSPRTRDEASSDLK